MAIAIVSENLVDYRERVIECIDERGFKDALDSGPQIRHLGHFIVWLEVAPRDSLDDRFREYGRELLDDLISARKSGLPW